MKLKLFALSVMFCYALQAQEDYQIVIDGKTYNVALDQKIDVKVKGKKAELMVKLKDTLLYKSEYVSFNYPKRYKVASTDVEEGIKQLMLMNAEGSGFLIQEYDGFNPTMMTEMMLSEVTKESVSYGYEIKREDYKRSLKSGEEVDVLKAVLSYKGEFEIYEIAALGKKDQGVLIMTMQMDNLDDSDGKQLITTIWKSLELELQ